MSTTKSGYEGQLYYGAAGSTASTQLLNVEDLDYDTPLTKAETTIRGAGTSLPIETEKPVSVGAKVTFSMFMRTGDSSLIAMIAAARLGAAVAIRTKSYASGLGYDGDMTLTVKHGMTLKGQSKFDFEGTPTDDEGRAPQLNV